MAELDQGNSSVDTAFPCTECGACCMMAHRVPETVRPAPITDDGACSLLASQPDGRHTCSVYETRQPICRIDELQPAAMSRAEYFELTAKLCNMLQEPLGMGERWRVVLDDE